MDSVPPAKTMLASPNRMSLTEGLLVTVDCIPVSMSNLLDALGDSLKPRAAESVDDQGGRFNSHSSVQANVPGQVSSIAAGLLHLLQHTINMSLQRL